MNVAKLISEDCFFLCGEREVLSPQAIKVLLFLDCQYLCFVNPPRKIVDYLDEITDKSRYSIIEKFDDLSDRKELAKNLIMCGLKYAQPLNNKRLLSRLSNDFDDVHMFFDKELGMLGRGYWLRKLENPKVYDYSFSEFIEKNFRQERDTSATPIRDQSSFFTNREKEIEKHRDFLNIESLRCCIVVGLSGIGKDSFIRKLKQDEGIGENCFEFSFVDKNEGTNSLIKLLQKKLGIESDKKEVDRIKLHNKDTISSTLLSVFEEFDSIENARLIFRNFHRIFNAKRNEFYQRDMAIFFDLLINRESYKKNNNKIYIVSNELIFFKDLSSQERTMEIYLEGMSPNHIKNILKHKFNQISRSKLATAIMHREDAVIAELLNGHPEIAALFVGVCRTHSIDVIIDDETLRGDFEKEKAERLISKIQIDYSEKELLSYLSLFREEFEIDAITFKISEPMGLLDSLLNKFLLDKIDDDYGGSKYHVSDILRAYVIDQMSKDEAKKNHETIADYYWEKESTSMTSSSRSYVNYKHALYHYKQADNKEKISLLTVYFKDIFLNIANDLFEHGESREALFYFNEVLSHLKLQNLSCRDLARYLICKQRVGERLEAGALFYQNISERRCGRSSYFTAAYADYLYRSGEYSEAETYCLKSLKLYDFSINANVLYPKVIRQLDGKAEASNWIMDRIKFIENKAKNKSRLIPILSESLYSNLEYHTVLKEVFWDTIYLLKKVDMFSAESLKLSPEVSEDEKNECIQLFEKARECLLLKPESKKEEDKDHTDFYYLYPANQYDFRSTYSGYLSENGLIERAKEIFNEKKSSSSQAKKIQDVEWMDFIEDGLLIASNLSSDNHFRAIVDRYHNLQYKKEISQNEIGFYVESMLDYCEEIMDESSSALKTIIRTKNLQFIDAQIAWALIKEKRSSLAGVLYCNNPPRYRDFELFYAQAHLLSRYKKLAYLRCVYRDCLIRSLTSDTSSRSQVARTTIQDNEISITEWYELVKMALVKSTATVINVEGNAVVENNPEITKSITQNFHGDVGNVAAENYGTMIAHIGKSNTEDVLALLSSLRQVARSFPEQQREETVIHIDDLTRDLNNEPKPTPSRLKARVVALLGVVVALGGSIAQVTDFANNVLDLSDKLGVPTESIEPQLQQVKQLNPEFNWSTSSSSY